MFAYIKGKLTHKEAAFAIVEANGIGYQINIPLSTYTALGNSEECQLFTFFHVREDAQTLFGFATTNEKSVFLDLIGINGVGPSTALAALSALSTDEIKHAIASENTKMVQTIKGVGGKSAQRIILELKDKYQKEGIGGDKLEKGAVFNNSLRQEALTALTTLGVMKSSAEKTIDKILKTQPDNLDLETLIKLSLKSA